MKRVETQVKPAQRPPHHAATRTPALRGRLLIAVCLFSGSGATSAASFPCAKAATAVEHMICKDAGLSALDEHLAQYYAAARMRLRDAQTCLQADQRQWLRNTRDSCKDAQCLERAYLLRLAELDPLQPGVTAIRHRELPKTRSLVWVIAPARDTVAAPPVRNLRPLTVRGRIVNEIAGGDGFVLQAAGSGTKHAIMSLMFLEAPAIDMLDNLARTPGATYEASGYGERESDGATHFAPSRCIFIYRLPH